MVLKARTRIGALVFGCAVLWALPNAASADVYLDLEGIPGESIAVGFENQIELGSFQLAVGRNAAAKGPSFSEVSVTKQLDKSSPQLMLRTANGAPIPTATVRFTRTGAEKVDVYQRYCFTGVRLTGYSQSQGGGGDRPSESVSFSYATIVQSYTQGSDTGGAGTVFAAGWDLLRNGPFNPACTD
jgi:type VI secretion system secreted protein Hcp